MTRHRAWYLVLAGAGYASTAPAQCPPEWWGYTGPWLDHVVYALVTWDPDGPGPARPVVVAGGNFTRAGSTVLNFVGYWDGTAWRPMGPGVSGTVLCATIYDPDGAGPALPGPVIGGVFTQSGGVTVNHIVRFDGGQWRPFGGGLTGSALGDADALFWHGNWLIASGQFWFAGGVPVQGLARWDGSAWHAFPDEGAAGANAYAAINGTLYAGGRFLVPGGSITERTAVLRWDDPVWTSVGDPPINDDVNALAVYRGRLIAAGDFTNVATRLAAWDGTRWVPLGAGTDGRVRALQVFDPDGPGPHPDLLIAGGTFSQAGGQSAPGIAAWDGAQWTALGVGTSDTVRALAVWEGRLVVGGDFFTAGGIVTPGLAFWGCVNPCYPNCDGSTATPGLTVNDLVCFTQRFAAADPYANCDGSTTPPVLSVSDFVCFMQRFSAGCR